VTAELSWRRVRDSFFVRLLAGVLVTALPIMIILALLLTQRASDSLTQATKDAAHDVARGAALRMDDWVHAREDELFHLADAMEVRLGDRSLGPELARLAKGDDDFTDIEVLDLKGHVVASSGSAQFDPSGASWFVKAQSGTVHSPLTRDAAGLHWYVAVPMQHDSGPTVAVLVGELDPSKVAEVLTDVGPGTSSELHAIDSAGELIYSSSWGQIDKTQMAARGALLVTVPAAEASAALAGQNGAGRLTDFRGKDVLAGYAPVKRMGWAIVASEETTVALEPVASQRMLAVILVLLAGGLTFVFAVAFALIITRPVTALTRTAEAISAGDLKARAKPGGAIEIRRLGEAFNRMVQQLTNVVGELREVSRSVSDDLAASTTEQSAAVTETSASMEELSRTSSVIAQTMERLAARAQEMRESIQQAQADLARSSERTVALAQKVNDITGILDLINEIADQTNLLALNAAIEAARAGDVGRGFAVVADEVRRLAERSKTSAAQIAKIMESAQSETNATVLAMEKGSKQMDRGRSLMEQVSEVSSQVQLTTQQQRAATEQVVKAMEQLAIASRRISATAQEIATSAGSRAATILELERTARPAKAA
jgi:methyl-accepting chemotaxis protein